MVQDTFSDEQPDQGSELIATAAQLIRHARHAVAFTGAGISTESGIPDFRSGESGLWNGVDPMAVASIYGFRRNPAAFYEWVRPLTHTTLNASPNAAHYTLAWLEQHGYLQSVITQNIDMLHTRAGTGCIYELHGHMREATCISCFKVFDAEPVLARFLSAGEVPRCPVCDGVLKPNVILFGEQLPVRELQGAQEAARKCDLMIVIGSSLEVAPAGDIPLLARRTGAKLIIINLDPTPADTMAEVVIHARAAHVLPQIARQVELMT
jgi:NAD-dependent deacetylase